MSDIILKFYPKENVETNNCDKIKNTLIEKKIVKEEEEIWGKAAHKADSNMKNYFRPEWEYAEEYFSNTHILIKENGYGIDSSGVEMEYFDRNSVVELHNADGTITEWNNFSKILTEITGVEYVGNWEIL